MKWTFVDNDLNVQRFWYLLLFNPLHYNCFQRKMKKNCHNENYCLEKYLYCLNFNVIIKVLKVELLKYDIFLICFLENIDLYQCKTEINISMKRKIIWYR